MKIIKLLMFIIPILGFSQLGLPIQARPQTPDVNTALINHYAKVYDLATKLADYDQQITALLNIYTLKESDQTLFLLSQAYVNKKDYKKAFVCINSSKDSTAFDVLNTKGWLYKLNNQPKISNQYFKRILEKNKEKRDIAFQIAVNDFESSNIVNAKQIVAEYQKNTKPEETVVTYDKNLFYTIKLNAAWENLSGMILFVESSANNTLQTNKDKILKYFDNAISLDNQFLLAQQNKQNFLKLMSK